MVLLMEIDRYGERPIKLKEVVTAVTKLDKETVKQVLLDSGADEEELDWLLDQNLSIDSAGRTAHFSGEEQDLAMVVA